MAARGRTMVKEFEPYKGWRIVVGQGQLCSALLYRPGSDLSERYMPSGPDENAVVEAAKRYVDKSSAE
jgi:hypothetical protein